MIEQTGARALDTTVRLTVADGVGHLELRRPQSANALDVPTARQLHAAVESMAGDHTVRAVLVTGAGPRFCAGGDVAAMMAAPEAQRAAYLEELAGAADAALVALGELDKPVVAAVQGVVAGAGLGVMMSCDLVVAAAGTRFLSAYGDVGLTPDCGVSWLLPRAVGQQRALELLLTPRVLSAEEARGWGLVNEVVADDEFATRGRALAEQLAGPSAHAAGQARRLVRNNWRLERRTAGERETATIAAAVSTSDAVRLLGAFVSR